MGVAILLLVLALGKVVNYVEDHGNLANENYNNIGKQALMAMLVHWIYFRDLKCWEYAFAWLMDYNNKRAKNYGDLHWEPYPCRKSESWLEEYGLAFLRRKRSHCNPNAPGLAIVVRGTIPTRVKDLSADAMIAVQRLNKSDRVRRTMEEILEVVKRFREENPDEHICMAGHSLGAAIAFIAGGVLYSEYRIDIDTHLFNPPLKTVVGVFTPGVHDPKLRECIVWLKEKFAKLSGNKAAPMDKEWAQFTSLQNWVPTFYINPGDWFGSEYMAVFDTPVGTPGDVISLQGIFSKLFSQDATYFKNIVPSAHVYISTWKKSCFILAHSLRQWHKYQPKHIKLEYHRVDLLSRSVFRSTTRPTPPSGSEAQGRQQRLHDWSRNERQTN